MAEEPRDEMMEELFGTSDNDSDEEREDVERDVNDVVERHIGSPTTSDGDREETALKSRRRKARLESDDDEEEEEMAGDPEQEERIGGAGLGKEDRKLMQATGLESSDDEDEDVGPSKEAAEKAVRETGLASEDEIEEESEKEDRRGRKREKLYGPPLHLQAPLKPLPGTSDNLVVVRSSNILTIEAKPFDPDSFDEDDSYLDEKGTKRVRLDDNIALWREVVDEDGNIKRESNARFVKWSDGTWQLMIGTEVLNVQRQSMAGDQTQLFVRHPRGLLQGQGKLVWKMRLMPSSLASKSHRRLTQLVDSKHKKVYKVKTVATTVDPEKEKEAREKAEQDRVAATENLARRQDRHMRKFGGDYDTYSRDRDSAPRALNPDYLEELEYMDEEEGAGGRGDRRRRDLEERMAREAEAEDRIMRAKRDSRPPAREPPRKKSKGAPPRGRDLETDSEEEEDEEDIFSEEEDEYHDSEEEAREQKKKAKQQAKEVEESPARQSAGKKVGGRRVVMTDSEDEE